jgi:hypothetical protein
MIELKTQVVTKEVEEVVEKHVLCNRCGRKDRAYPDPQYEEVQEYLHVDLVGGYGSRFPGDSNRVRFDVCQDCLREWVATFKVEPQYGEDELT